jgi:hypothetical protein
MSKIVTPEALLNSQVEEFNKGNISFYFKHDVEITPKSIRTYSCRMSHLQANNIMERVIRDF